MAYLSISNKQWSKTKVLIVLVCKHYVFSKWVLFHMKSRLFMFVSLALHDQIKDRFFKDYSFGRVSR